MRAHFTRAITDDEGNLLPNVNVSVYSPGTTTPIGQVIYSTDTGNNVLANPFVSNTGVIDFYLDIPARVRLGIVQGGLPVQYYENVDVLAAGTDSQHLGSGPASLVIGTGASSPGDSSTAVGPAASAGGNSATALGTATNALGDHSVAIGSAASSQGLSGLAVGRTATATAESSSAVGNAAQASALSATAIGDGSEASWARSTAVGAGAVTSGEDQVMLGSATSVAEIPPGGALVMSAPGGARWRITISDTGVLTSTAL